MTPAPLPPHERSWRHPSELAVAGPLDDSGAPSNRRALLLAGSTTMAVLALVLVATVSTGRSPAPFAVSATTVPMVRVDLQRRPVASAAAAVSDDLRVWRNDTHGMTRSSVAAVSGAPNAVSAAPVATPDADALSLASGLPADDELVLVLTTSHTYRVSWRDIHHVVAPDDAVVMTLDGGLVAVFVSGELRMLVDA